MLRFITLLLFFVGTASGQTLLLSGGASTLYGGSGASVTAYMPQATVTASAGFADGRFVFGASDRFQWHGLDATAGDSAFGFSFDGAGLGVQVRGVAVQRMNAQQSVAAFVGATGVGFNVPWMQTQRAQHIGAGLFYQRKVSSNFLFSSLEVLSGGQRTAVQGAQYQNARVKLSASGGVEQNQKLFNAQAYWQPTAHLSFAASHNDFFLATKMVSNSVSAFAVLGHFSVLGSLLDGEARGKHVAGASAGVGFQLGAFSAHSNWFESNHRAMLVNTFAENFRHFTLSQVVTRSQNQTAYAFGGGYTGNRLSVSVSHSVLFFPVGGRGFAQVTSVTIGLRIHDSVVTLQTNADPQGKLKWSAYAQTYTTGPLHVAEQHAHAKPSGKLIVTGQVVNQNGDPVEGAAVQVGQAVVFTASDGKFFVHVKHKRVTVQVLLDQFVNAGVWSVSKCPATTQPGTEAVITLRRER